MKTYVQEIEELGKIANVEEQKLNLEATYLIKEKQSIWTIASMVRVMKNFVSKLPEFMEKRHWNAQSIPRISSGIYKEQKLSGY